MMLFLPALTGLLLIVSFPRFNQGYLAWVAFVPLIAFVFRIKTVAGAFWGGFVAGVLELFVLLIWIPAVLQHYGGLSVVLAWIAYGLMVLMLACYPGIACAAVKLLITRGGDSFLFIFPVIWIVSEYAQTLSPFGGFPWLLAGYSQSEFLNLIQIADLTGVFGISFLVLWFGVAIFWAGLHRGRSLIAYWPLMSGAMLIVLCMLYGSISLRHWDQIKPDFQTAMLQGNLAIEEPEKALAEKFQSGYVTMADRLKSSNIDLLILPESPAPVLFQFDARYRQILENLAKRYSFGLVFSNIRSHETGSVQHYFNSAYFMDRNGNLTGVYDKIHLVPFGEYIPAKRVFSFVEAISKDVGEFSPGNDHKVMKLGDHRSNAIICFEAVFPDLARRFVQNGSQLMINVTNDGWYGDSAAPYQHFAIARWRAIENRRYLLRAANTGISSVIEPTGRIQTVTGILQEAICEGRFAFITQQTIYTRYGDVLVFLCAIIAWGSLIYVFVFGLKKRRSNLF